MVLFALSLIMFAACCVCSNGQQGGKQSIEEWFPVLSPSVATVTSLHGERGTAFVFKTTPTTNYLVTTFHAFHQAPYLSIEVKLPKSDFQTGVLIGYCSYHDIAVLEVERLSSQEGVLPLTISQNSLNFGTELFTIANALGKGLSVYSGIASNPLRIINPQGGDNLTPRYIPVSQISVPINAGASGSPVFDMFGQVKGMAVASRVHDGTVDENFVQGISYMIPSNIVQSIATQIILEKWSTNETLQVQEVSSLNARVVRVAGVERELTGQDFVLDLSGLRVAHSNNSFIITYITDAKRNQFLFPTETPQIGDTITALGDTSLQGANISKFLSIWHNFVDTRNSPLETTSEQLTIRFTSNETREGRAGFINIRRIFNA